MDTVHICRGVNTRYQACVRLPFHRNWVLVGKPRKREKLALADLMKAFSTGVYKRGRIVMYADYYDPETVLSIHR